MYVSNIHTCSLICLCKIKPSACMELFKNHQPVMKMKHTYMLKLLRNSSITVTFQGAPNYVCMFENPLHVMENETYTLEHELENSTSMTENRRKRDPYRGNVMLDINESKKTLSLSRIRRVYFGVCLNKVQKPCPCEGFCV